MLISTSSQLKIIALNRNNFLSTFFFFGWSLILFVGEINIGMIMDNSFIIPWLSSLEFQDTINNKARFMIFLLIFWTAKYLSLFRVICYLFNFVFFIIYFFFMEFPWGFEALDQTILLVLSFFQKKFLKFIFTHFVLIGWNSVPLTSFLKTKIQLIC